MKKINSLNDLLMEELAEILSAESQLSGALPRLTRASHSPALKSALHQHLETTESQVSRLQEMVDEERGSQENAFCQNMEEMIKEGEETVHKIEKGAARDAGIIRMMQRFTQYEIARYKTAREHAADFGRAKIVEALTETLNEERAMKFHLNELAQYMINVQAIDPRKL